MPNGVFICHASEDAPTARQTVEALEAAGVDCWIAPRDIPPGSHYTQAILDGLAAAPALILVFSEAANLSPHVRRELETAVGTDTALFPVRIEDVEPSASLRYFIGTAQWLDTVGIATETWETALVAGVTRLLGIATPATARPATARPATARPAVPVASPEPPTARPALPRPSGTTWGREALCTEVAALLGDGGERLVTLTGLGGVGKTRVAAEVSSAVPELDVLDDADPDAVHGLLAGTPTARVLATSRLPLGIPGERVVAVPPLDHESSLGLFRDVARSTAPSFDLDKHVAEVSEVCDLLGGFPLGLVLAAGRLRVVGLDRLRRGLSTHLDLVAALGDSLQWSLDRLESGPGDLLGRLAVFEGPVTLDAVEAVAEDPDVLDAITLLVEGGLVQVDDAVAEPRYALPHPVRLLARRGLENSDRAEDAHAAVAAYFLTRTADWRRRLDTVEGPDVHAEFKAQAKDVEAAIHAAILAGRTDTAFELLVTAVPVWIAAGRLAEPRALCGQLLEALPDGDPHAARLHAILGRIAYQLTEWSVAERELDTARQLGTEVGDDVAVLNARLYLSGVLMMGGNLAEGQALAREVYAETEASGLYPQSAEGLFMLALSHMIAGNVDEERRTHERRLTVVRAHGDVARTADQLNTLAEIALDEDDPEKARRYSEESLAMSADRFPLEHRDATITLARATAVLGDHGAAGRILSDALAASGRHGQSLATAQCLRIAGVLAEAGGSPALAIRLFAAAQALSPSPTGTDDPPEVDLAAALGRARAALDDREQEREWTLGGALPLPTMLTQLDEAIGLNGS